MKLPKNIRTAVRNLPKGNGAYDYAYQDAMGRIERQGPKSVEFAKRVLSWITCAKRPLTTTELQHALAVDVGEPELDLENLPHIGDMVSVCAGLVTVDQESRIIRLVHYTTQEYFQRTQERWFPDGQLDMARVCTTYLAFRAFESGECDTDTALEERLRIHQLYDYSVRNWGHHVREISVLCPEVKHFLSCEKLLEASNQARLAEKRFSSDSGYSQRCVRQNSALHLAAYFGAENVATYLLQGGIERDVKSSDGRTPLSVAAERGQIGVAELLIKKGANVDLEDNEGRTPLSWATKSGYNVVQLLLQNGADPSSKATDYYIKGWTPLHYAAIRGDEAVVKLLLEQAIDPDPKTLGTYKYNRNRTPLSYASGRGHVAVVKLLLAQAGVDPNSMSTSEREWGRTPLSYAAENGHGAIVKMLLAQPNIDVTLNATHENSDWEVTDLGTPLTYAIKNGHEAIVKMLIEKGADPMQIDKDGWTLLAWAASGTGNETVAKLLIELGVRPESQPDDDEWRPLWLAAREGNEAIVRLLLEMGPRLQSSDDGEATALSLASGNGHDAVVKLLLDYNANTNSRLSSTDLGYPLWIAALNGHETVARLLLDRNADWKYITDDGSTPLKSAARNGREGVVRALLEKGADSGCTDNEGQTPLAYAAMYGHAAVVELLLEKGADPGCTDGHDQTPLQLAEQNGHESVVKMLLGRTARV